MSKVMLRLRNLQTSAASTKEFESVEASIPWLKERPRFIEVLGVVFEGITREENDSMKSSMRPLDDEERGKMRELDEKEAEEREKRNAARKVEAEVQARAAREAAKNADPKRPMELRYRYDQPELGKTDELDEREITEEAKKAVLAWVHERMEWVADRGQTIGEAKVLVFPGEVPAKAERIVSGSFIPVTAPPKPAN
jgi:hypothetical protein